jgi:ATP-dependent helicase HrpB
MEGDILVFLPGASEIRQTATALDGFAVEQRLMLLPLHGDMEFGDQVRAVEPAALRKVILATNVAESSVTIPGVGVVIDSGLAREAGYSAWSGLPRLSLSRISKASADQRAGRAGRTREGHVLRLYTRHDFETRRDFDRPEIQRLDLSELVLALHGLGVRTSREVEWLDPPPGSAIEAAESLLQRLGAVDTGGRLSATGTDMLRVPVHPRLSRMILEGRRLGVVREACLAAALMSERDIRSASRAFGGSKVRALRRGGDSDLAALIELFEKAQQSGFESAVTARFGLDSRALASVARHHRHLERAIPSRSSSGASVEDREEALCIALLAGFPDRVARLKKKGSRELLLSSGGTALLSESSVVRDSPLLLALDVEEKTGGKGSLDTESVIVRLASALEAEWLAAFFPEQIAEEHALVWDEPGGRVDELVRTSYGCLVLEESRRPAPASTAATALLAEAELRRELRDFPDADAFLALRRRLELIAQYFPRCDAAEALTDTRPAVTAACAGRRSLAELKRASLVEAALAPLAADIRRLLERETPERIVLPGGRKLKVHYEADGPPWVESRLQDFFGMRRTPAICAGRQSLTLHLLAPNMRPVQVTQDLAGFWRIHYPELRRQLKRRYPKHAWPEV